MPKVHLGVDPYPGKLRFSVEVKCAAKERRLVLQDIADAAFMTRVTLADRMNHPGDFRIREIISIAKSTGKDPVELFKILLGKEE